MKLTLNKFIYIKELPTEKSDTLYWFFKPLISVPFYLLNSNGEFESIFLSQTNVVLFAGVQNGPELI